MKTLLTSLIALTALNAFAAEIPGSAKLIKISHVVVGPQAIAFREVPCTMPDSDLTCTVPTDFKDMVAVTVDYTTSSIAEDESFTVRFDASEFSAQELAALSINSATKRVKAAKEIFSLAIREEERSGSHTYCPYEIPYTCRPDEEWTDTYETVIKIVNVVRK